MEKAGKIVGKIKPDSIESIARLTLFASVSIALGITLGVQSSNISELKRQSAAFSREVAALRQLINTKAADRYTGKEATIQKEAYDAMLNDIRERLLSLERKLMENK